MFVWQAKGVNVPSISSGLLEYGKIPMVDKQIDLGRQKENYDKRLLANQGLYILEFKRAISRI